MYTQQPILRIYIYIYIQIFVGFFLFRSVLGRCSPLVQLVPLPLRHFVSPVGVPLIRRADVCVRKFNTCNL